MRGQKPSKTVKCFLNQQQIEIVDTVKYRVPNQ